MKTLLLSVIIISAVFAITQDGFDKTDTLMTVVKTNVVADLKNDVNSKFEGVQYETPRFAGAKVETTVDSEEKNMAKYGLSTVDDNMEVDHKEYKKTSQKKAKQVEATNKKIQTSLDTIKEELDGKVQKIDDEAVLLKALLKLAILKKAVQIHLDEVEANIQVDMKIQDQVVKQIAELENLIYKLDEKDAVWATYVVRDHWTLYTTYVERSYGFVSIFDGVHPYPVVRGRVVYGWMPYLVRYFRWSYYYYWPGVYFGSWWGWPYYRFWSYFPTTYWYSSFVGYYDYALIITNEDLATLEQEEAEAEEKLNEGIDDLEDPDLSVEDLEKTFDDAIDGLRDLNDEITKTAEDLIDQVTQGEPDKSNELSQLDLSEDEFRRKGDDILANFDEEIANETETGDDELFDSEDEAEREANKGDDDDEEPAPQNEDLAEIAEMEEDLLGDHNDESFSDAVSETDDSAESDNQDVDSEDEVKDPEDEEQHGFESVVDSDLDSDVENNEAEEEEEEDGEEEEDDPCAQYSADPEAYKQCQGGEEEQKDEGDQFGQQQGGFNEQQQGGNAWRKKLKNKKQLKISGFKKTMKHLAKGTQVKKHHKLSKKLRLLRRRR